VRVGVARVRRTECRDANVERSATRSCSLPAGLREDRLSRNPLLQQKLCCLHSRIGVEALDEAIATKHVGQCDRSTCPGGGRRMRGRSSAEAGRRAPPRRRNPRLIVDRFVEAEPALEPGTRQCLEVVGRGRGSTSAPSAVAYGAITRSSARPRFSRGPAPRTRGTDSCQRDR
jgi:hypothetical protein